jgi:hypothetical protein
MGQAIYLLFYYKNLSSNPDSEIDIITEIDEQMITEDNIQIIAE